MDRNLKRKKKYTIEKQKVVRYPGMDAWHFVGVPKDMSAEIKELQPRPHRGFGSVPVKVTIGKTVWETSIFPDKASGMYLLPLKAAVRRAENIEDGTLLTYTIVLR